MTKLEFDPQYLRDMMSLVAQMHENRREFHHEFTVQRGWLSEVTEWCREHLPETDFVRILYTIWVRTDEQAVLLRLAYGEHVHKVDPDNRW